MRVSRIGGLDVARMLHGEVARCARSREAVIFEFAGNPTSRIVLKRTTVRPALLGSGWRSGD